MADTPHRARKRFGQNFLHDPGIIGQIIGVVGFGPFIAIGPAMKYAAVAAEACHVRTHWFETTAAANRDILALLEPGDTILLKGSHGMHLETLLETLRSGIDTGVAAAGAV